MLKDEGSEFAWAKWWDKGLSNTEHEIKAKGQKELDTVQESKDSHVPQG